MDQQDTQDPKDISQTPEVAFLALVLRIVEAPADGVVFTREYRATPPALFACEVSHSEVPSVDYRNIAKLVYAALESFNAATVRKYQTSVTELRISKDFDQWPVRTKNGSCIAFVREANHKALLDKKIREEKAYEKSQAAEAVERALARRRCRNCKWWELHRHPEDEAFRRMFPKAGEGYRSCGLHVVADCPPADFGCIHFVKKEGA